MYPWHCFSTWIWNICGFLFFVIVLKFLNELGILYFIYEIIWSLWKGSIIVGIIQREIHVRLAQWQNLCLSQNSTQKGKEIFHQVSIRRKNPGIIISWFSLLYCCYRNVLIFQKTQIPHSNTEREHALQRQSKCLGTSQPPWELDSIGHLFQNQLSAAAHSTEWRCLSCFLLLGWVLRWPELFVSLLCEPPAQTEIDITQWTWRCMYSWGPWPWRRWFSNTLSEVGTKTKIKKTHVTKYCKVCVCSKHRNQIKGSRH